MRAVDAVPATDSAEAWVSGREAVAMSKRHIYSILKACLLGRVRYRADRGESLRFSRDDIARLVD